MQWLAAAVVRCSASDAAGTLHNSSFECVCVMLRKSSDGVVSQSTSSIRI
jgi:hypothetical protein